MKNKILNTIYKSILSGILISIGGIANLLSDNKYMGAFLFSAGLFFIVENGYNLFTGKAPYILTNKKEDNLMVPIILIFNFIGCIITGLLISLTRIYPVINAKAVSLVLTKTSDTWYSVFILSILCGIMIFLGVDTYKKTNNIVSKVFSIIICILVFILSGYEHCIANMFYITVSGIVNYKVVFYLLIMIFGNTIGGILFPFFNILINKTKESE